MPASTRAKWIVRSLVAVVAVTAALFSYGFFKAYNGFVNDDNSTSSEETVLVLKKPLPTDEQKKRDALISIFSKEEQKFDEAYTTDNWKSNFTVFAEALVQTASVQKLDATSLRDVLDLVLKDSQDRIAYLPVRAYQTLHGNQPVWIVVVRWEYPMVPEVPLSHIRAFAFDQKTLKQVGFATCN